MTKNYEFISIFFTSVCNFCSYTLVGEELYTQTVLLVQSILADRYTNRRELRLLSLESTSSAEYRIKKFLNFT